MRPAACSTRACGPRISIGAANGGGTASRQYRDGLVRRHQAEDRPDHLGSRRDLLHLSKFAPAVSAAATTTTSNSRLAAVPKSGKTAPLASRCSTRPSINTRRADVWTVEGSFAQALPRLGCSRRPSAPCSASSTGEDAGIPCRIRQWRRQYVYWNAGVTFAFLEKWSIDVRYWDTNLGDNAGGSAWSAPAPLSSATSVSWVRSSLPSDLDLTWSEFGPSSGPICFLGLRRSVGGQVGLA